MADKPVTREEKYLAYLTGDYKGELPKPITRKEKYLYELCLKGIGGEISPEEIKAAVNEYLEKNPVKPGATTEQAQQIEQNKKDINLLKEDLVSTTEIQSRNIWDEKWAVGYIDDNSGEIKEVDYASGIVTKNYIKVKPNTKYYLSEVNSAYVYTYRTASPDGLIGRIYKGTDGLLEFDSDTNYIAFYYNNYGKIYKNDIILNESDNLDGVYEPYKITAVDSKSRQTNGLVKIKSGLNKYNPVNELEKKILTNDGGIVDDDDFVTTDYIKVVEGKTYYNSIEGGDYRKVCFYDRYYKCIGDNYTIQNESNFTVPVNACHTRLSIKNGSREYLALMDSNSPYEEYNPIGGYLIDDTIKSIEYGNELFTSNYDSLGEKTDPLVRTCLKRKRESNVIGIKFHCYAYPVHTYFCAFNEKGNLIPKYSLAGGSDTHEEHTVYFGKDVSYYSVQSLNINFSETSLTEILDGYESEIYKIKEKSDNNNKNIYDSFKKHEMTEWSNLRFGMFIHWGVYSAWAGKYAGKDIDGNDITLYGETEWMWQKNKIPKDIYKAKEIDFTAEKWNADYICRLAKMLGMKYIVITSRHHEGFSLMQSDNCEWDIRSSSCTRDVLMELKEACNRHHLKFCLYVSPMLDWCDEGGYGQEAWNGGSDPYTWEQHKDFVVKQTKFMNELVEKYDPYVIWYDGGTYISMPDDLKKIFNDNQLKNYPYVIVNERGEGTLDYYLAENTYADYPNTERNYERCAIICGWGYNTTHDNYNNYVKAQNIIWDMLENMGRGFNYLLNISPRGDGSIPEQTMTIFSKISDFFKKYTFFNGAKRMFNDCQPSWGRPICIDNSVYMFVIPQNESREVYVDSIITSDIKSVYVYNADNPESKDNYEIISDDRIKIKNLPSASSDYYTVIRIDFYTEPTCMDYNIIDTTISGLSIVRDSCEEWATKTTGVTFDGIYRFGTDVSNSHTRFKFNGESGNYKVNLNGTKDGDLNFTINLYDDQKKKISTGTNISLEKDKIYTLEIIKTGSGTLEMTDIQLVN